MSTEPEGGFLDFRYFAPLGNHSVPQMKGVENLGQISHFLTTCKI